MISVCIATHNGEKYIAEQINSILPQLSSDDEIIISDDGSTDSTLNLIQLLNDPRIKIFQYEHSQTSLIGVYKQVFFISKNFENAIYHSSGDYILLCDQDDIWLPNKVKVVMTYFEAGYKMVLHNCKVIDIKGNVLMESYFKLSQPTNSIVSILTRCFYLGCCMAFTKEFKTQILPMSQRKPIPHDHWIALRIRMITKQIKFVAEPLLLYRRHGDNASSGSEKSSNNLFFKIGYRIRLVYIYMCILTNIKFS